LTLDPRGPRLTPIALTLLKEDLMPRVAALWLVVSALLLYSNPGQAQIQQPSQQPQLQQQQRPQMQQLPFEQRRALQLPGTLVVERAGMTLGKIGGEGAQGLIESIDCGSRCEYAHRSSSPGRVRLFLRRDTEMSEGAWTQALEGSLVEWSGACAGYFWHCDIPMTADAKPRVIVTIGKPRLTVRMHGNGAIEGIPACTGSNRECVQEYGPVWRPDNLRVPPVITLRATGPRIWTGCDASSGGVASGGVEEECKVTVRFASEVNVKFQVVLRSVTIHRTGNGSGEVLTNPAPVGRCPVQQGAPQATLGLPCLEYEQGTDLTLTATGQFTRWTAGPCNGQTSPTCRFTVGSDANVSALYIRQ
jgi:hypothetical protein